MSLYLTNSFAQQGTLNLIDLKQIKATIRKEFSPTKEKLFAKSRVDQERLKSILAPGFNMCPQSMIEWEAYRDVLINDVIQGKATPLDLRSTSNPESKNKAEKYLECTERAKIALNSPFTKEQRDKIESCNERLKNFYTHAMKEINNFSNDPIKNREWQRAVSIPDWLLKPGERDIPL